MGAGGGREEGGGRGEKLKGQGYAASPEMFLYVLSSPPLPTFTSECV